MARLETPAAWRRLIEESQGSLAVIEEAVGALREQVHTVDPSDGDVIEILRSHLLAIGSPSDVSKFFSLELLERTPASQRELLCLEVLEALARSPIQPERTYPVERAIVKRMGEQRVTKALPALAVLAGREIYPLSRTAARAVAAIVGSTCVNEITERFTRADLPEASQPEELGEGVGRALWPQRRTSAKSSQERRRELTCQNALPKGESQVCLRPEGERARQRRLKAILTAAGREALRCGNCDQQAETLRVGHVVPVARGGSDLAGNLVVLCGECRRKLPRGRLDAFEAEDRPLQGELPQLSLF